MSKFLILDTTSDRTLAICHADDKTYHTISAEGKGKTSALVIPIIDQTLASADIDKNELDAVFAIVGPGSFTGIRIGVSVISAISFALGIDKYSLTAFNGLGKKNDLKVIPSRNGFVYYEQNGEIGEMSLEDITASNQNVYARDVDVGNIVDDQSYVSKLVSVALERLSHGKPDDVLIPLYVKKSSAERLKETK